MARATADLHVGLSELDVEVGDLDERQASTSRPPRRSASAPAMTESRYRWFVAMGLLAEPRATRRQAIALLDQAERALPAGLLPGRATHRGA